MSGSNQGLDLVTVELMKELAMITGKRTPTGWSETATVGDLQRLGVRAIRLKSKIESALDSEPEDETDSAGA